MSPHSHVLSLSGDQNTEPKREAFLEWPAWFATNTLQFELLLMPSSIYICRHFRSENKTATQTYIKRKQNPKPRSSFEQQPKPYT
jgi:hypothetical protein